MFVKPSRKVDKVFIHCSASDHPDHDSVDVIHGWHLQRGWSGIGYHYFIQKSGNVQEGRDLEKTPAAQAGYNSGTLAICLHGLSAHLFTADQLNSLVRLCVSIFHAYDGNITFHGHCEVSSKICPVFDYKQVLRLDQKGNMQIGNIVLF